MIKTCIFPNSTNRTFNYIQQVKKCVHGLTQSHRNFRAWFNTIASELSCIILLFAHSLWVLNKCMCVRVLCEWASPVGMLLLLRLCFVHSFSGWVYHHHHHHCHRLFVSVVTTIIFFFFSSFRMCSFSIIHTYDSKFETANKTLNSVKGDKEKDIQTLCVYMHAYMAAHRWCVMCAFLTLVCSVLL